MRRKTKNEELSKQERARCVVHVFRGPSGEADRFPMVAK